MGCFWVFDIDLWDVVSTTSMLPWHLGLKTYASICPRLQASINQSISAMEKVHRDMSNDYSTGVASGYTKKFLGPSANDN